jgi:predicted nucleic acid-binding protein
VNVIDSSAWLEYFADSANAAHFAAAVEDVPALVVPVICIYEVFKAVARQRDEVAAFRAVAFMRQGEVVEVSEGIALSAARISLAHRLPMADSLVLATARSRGAVLWTQDADFDGLPDVRYVPKAA